MVPFAEMFFHQAHVIFSASPAGRHCVFCTGGNLCKQGHRSSSSGRVMVLGPVKWISDAVRSEHFGISVRYFEHVRH